MHFRNNYFGGQHVLHKLCLTVEKLITLINVYIWEPLFTLTYPLEILTMQCMIFFMRTNNLMVDFSNTHSSTLSVLYNSYCMNVYGSRLYKHVECFYIAWRIDKRTPNVLTNLISVCLPINLMLEQKCIKYIWNFFNSTHELHKAIVY